MTREEAINTLAKIQKLLAIYPKRKKQKESVNEIDTAIGMAIEALNNTTDESNDTVKPKNDVVDLISRADVLALAEKGYIISNSNYKKVCDLINALPSADAVPVDRTSEWVAVKREEYEKYLADRPQGEWEHWGSPFSDESEVIDTIVCSVCGARFIEPKDEPKGEYNYCPNCGARMVKK